MAPTPSPSQGGPHPQPFPQEQGRGGRKEPAGTIPPPRSWGEDAQRAGGGPLPNEGQGWLRGAVPALIAALFTMVYLMKVPDPVEMVWDPDWGYQLAGATQIRHGFWPFLDFHALYGPLAFAASAFAQWVAGGRVIGEFGLSFLGYLISYLLLYGLTA